MRLCHIQDTMSSESSVGIEEWIHLQAANIINCKPLVSLSLSLNIVLAEAKVGTKRLCKDTYNPTGQSWPTWAWRFCTCVSEYMTCEHMLFWQVNACAMSPSLVFKHSLGWSKSWHKTFVQGYLQPNWPILTYLGLTFLHMCEWIHDMRTHAFLISECLCHVSQPCL